MSQITQFRMMIEELAKVDMENTPTFQFMFALRDRLMKHFSRSYAEKIVVNMTIELSEFDSNDDDWIAIVNSYVEMIYKAYSTYQKHFNNCDEMFLIATKKMSIKLEG